jgi:hypothetical protein
VTESKASRLKAQGREATAELQSALDAHRQFAEEAVRVIEELEHDAAIRENSVTEDAGMHSLDLLAWLCSDIRADQVDWHSGLVGTAGSGPWPIGEFDSFLQGLGFEVAFLPNPDLNCVVLGTDEWSDGDLMEQIYGRDGSELIVLSQPLFVAGLLKKINPLLSMDRNVLLAIAETHPALSLLIDRGFDWVFDEKSNHVTIWETTRDLAEKSPLRMAGYSVAVNTGPSETDRRRILKEFFFDPTPKGVGTASDHKRWGSAKSAQRLYGMATFLAWLCRYQGTNAPEAVQRWQGDLGWLRREFFRPTMQFEWPGSAEPDKPQPALWRPTTSNPKTALSPAAVWPFPTSKLR